MWYVITFNTKGRLRTTVGRYSPRYSVSAPLEDENDDPDAWTPRREPPNPGSDCAEIGLESGDVIIYDGGAPDAWIRSTVALEIAELA